MIVDDEKMVREGLKTLIDWSSRGFALCDEASDGNEAVTKILEQNPDLVILDIKMPELSGIQVTEAVRQQGYNGKIIILSGFSDFSYAQNAIRYGVESYLLKPIDEDELIAALMKVKEKIGQEHILELYNNQKFHDAKNMLLKHILTGSMPCVSQDFEEYGLALSNKPFQLVMLNYSNDSDIDMLHQRSYWKSIYPDYKTEYVIIENSIILLLKGMLSIQYFENHVLFYLNKATQDKEYSPFVIISETFSEVNSFPEFYQTLKRIANRRFFYYEGNKPVFCRKFVCKEDEKSSEKLSPIEFVESIYMAIMDKDTSLINATIKKLYNALQNRNFTIEQTFQVLINCLLQLKTLLNETYIKEFMEFNETELINKICNCSTLFEILQLFNERFLLLSNSTKNAKDNIIEKVLNYINIHFNEDLKLEKIAELFGYNPAYLGRLLSYRMGTNFNLYIEKKRLDKAIDMLINTDIKIPEISLFIGYQNVEYFYRKFKKYTSLTPGNYRAKHCDTKGENCVKVTLVSRH